MNADGDGRVLVLCHHDTNWYIRMRVYRYASLQPHVYKYTGIQVYMYAGVQVAVLAAWPKRVATVRF